ncbi:MAG: hypothetical protein B7C55_02305, partial [Actinomycetales bacterium mxb001]
MAVSSNGDDTQVMTSENGSVWRSRAGSFYENSWKAVTWAGDMFVAVSASGTGKQVMYARDGVTWSTRTSGTVPNQWQSVARGDAGAADNAEDDTIVAVGASADDSQVMTSVATPSPGGLRCISAWNGSTWSPLGAGVNGGTTSLRALNDDTLVVAGLFSFVGNYPYEVSGLATWAGGVWDGQGGGGFDQNIKSLLAVAPTTVYVGGDFWRGGCCGGITYTTTQPLPPANSPEWKTMSTGFRQPSSLTPGLVDALALLDDTVYAGGYFNATGDGGAALANLASWSGSSWNTVGPGLNSDGTGNTSVRALASDDARGLLYVGGTFDDTA